MILNTHQYTVIHSCNKMSYICTVTYIFIQSVTCNVKQHCIFVANLKQLQYIILANNLAHIKSMQLAFLNVDDQQIVIKHGYTDTHIHIFSHCLNLLRVTVSQYSHTFIYSLMETACFLSGQQDQHDIQKKSVQIYTSFG